MITFDSGVRVKGEKLRISESCLMPKSIIFIRAKLKESGGQELLYAMIEYVV